MANKVIGYVNLHSDVSLNGLTEKRPVASVSFLGRYGIIDFVLSNFSNSMIDSVGVLIKEKPRSLLKHMSNGNAWNFNSKNGGINLLYNEKHVNTMYNHDINNILENIKFFEKENPDYVVVAPNHIVTTMDYSELVENHIASGKDITIVAMKTKNAHEEFIGGDYIKIDSDTREVVGIEKNMGTAKNRVVSLETYVFSAKVFAKFLKDAQKVSAFFDLRDMLAYSVNERSINIYDYKGFAKAINSYESYYEVSMGFLSLENSTQVFKSNWPIFTKTNDTPPSKYRDDAKVVSAFIANGVIVDGTVEHSILGRNVKIGKGAIVKNSIILSDSVIDPGAHIENVIVDKEARVKNIKTLIGDSKSPTFIKEGDIV